MRLEGDKVKGPLYKFPEHRCAASVRQRCFASLCVCLVYTSVYTALHRTYKISFVYHEARHFNLYFVNNTVLC